MFIYDVIGYVYEAAVHCEECAAKRFPKLRGIDREGNEICVYTVGDACAADEDTYCDDCHEKLFEQEQE